MRKRRLLLATAALATAGIACKPRVVHGNTKHPTYPADAGVDTAPAPDAATESPPSKPEVIHSNPGPSLYDSGHK